MDGEIQKSLYKVFLYIIKYTPTLLTLFEILYLILSYLGIDGLAITCVGGTSIIFIILLYLIAEVFKFCNLFKLPLYYITTNKIILLADMFVGIPISTIHIFRLYVFIFGVYIILYIIYSYKNRNNFNKIDYIKQLCERYNCNCK